MCPSTRGLDFYLNLFFFGGPGGLLFGTELYLLYLLYD